MIDALAFAPQPSAPRPLRTPDIFRGRLANGLQVVVAPRPGIALVAAQLTVTTGAALDPAADAGLSSLAALLVGYGSVDLASEHFSTALDAIGAHFSGAAGYDSMSFVVSAMTPLFGEALGYAARALREPALHDDDLERIRLRVISELRVSAQTASSVARKTAGRLLFGPHPYGMPLGGTIESNEALTTAKIRSILAARIRPERATLVFVGDLTMDEGIAFAERAFGDWHAPAAAAPAIPERPQRQAPRTILVHLPDSGRSAVYAGYPAIERSDPRYHDAVMLNALLSGYSGKLNREIRVKRGLSYGASSALHARRDGGICLCSTLVEHGRVGETITVISDVLRGLRDETMSAAEMTTRKAMLRGSFGRTLETLQGVAGVIGSQIVYDLPDDDLRTYLDRMEAVDAAQVRALAAELFAGPPTVVVVGEAPVIRAQLGDQEYEEIDATELDFCSPGLRREEL